MYLSIYTLYNKYAKRQSIELVLALQTWTAAAMGPRRPEGAFHFHNNLFRLAASFFVILTRFFWADVDSCSCSLLSSVGAFLTEKISYFYAHLKEARIYFLYPSERKKSIVQFRMWCTTLNLLSMCFWR